MIAPWRDNDVLLRRVRARALALVPFSRATAERWLRGVDYARAQPTPRAILCIRCFRAPSLSRAWHNLVSAELQQVSAGAARPAHGPVPANAEAVLFADHAELLACLARDWLAGAVAACWWWQGLFCGTAAEQLALSVWRDAPEHVPAALSQLADSGDAVRLVRALGVGGAETLLPLILQSHGLQFIDLDTTGNPVARADVSRESSGKAALASHTNPMPQATADAIGLPPSELPTRAASGSGVPCDGERLPAPPWASCVAEAAHDDLHPYQQALLGISLMLQRAPSPMRQGDFAAAFRQWRRHAREGARNASAAHLESLRSASGTNARESYLAPARSDRATQVESSQRAAQPRAPTMTHGEAEVPKAAPILPAPSMQSLPTAYTAARVGDAVVPHRPASPPAAQREVIDTDLGGLFYLINLGIYLELYGDFTSPLRPGIALPIWDFMVLIGRRLLPDYPSDDAVWSLLTRLAGRDDDTPPGLGFELDAARPPVDACRDDSRCPLEAWLAWLMPLVQARLSLALDVAAEAVGATLLLHHARVAVTATHLDVTLSLADLPLAVRAAGLDRDPGWVPAAGRYVAFHFE